MTDVPRDRAPRYPVHVAIRCFLGHGASGTAASMAPFVDGLRARGVAATAIDLPKRKAEDAVPAFHLVVPSAADVAVGGHSFGGRVASLAAAEPDAPYAGLVLFSYPLHPPGSPERTDARIAHWPAIRCPVLLLSGESDPFAQIDLLRAAVPLLADAELVTYPRLGHTLKPVLEDALDRAAAFLRGCRAADAGPGRRRQRAAVTSISTRVVRGQGGHAHRRPGRRLGREVRAVDSVHRREVREVAEVDRASHDVARSRGRPPCSSRPTLSSIARVSASMPPGTAPWPPGTSPTWPARKTKPFASTTFENG